MIRPSSDGVSRSAGPRIVGILQGAAKNAHVREATAGVARICLLAIFQAVSRATQADHNRYSVMRALLAGSY